MEIAYRHLARGDNISNSGILYAQYREFGIARPGTVYFDPTTDNIV